MNKFPDRNTLNFLMGQLFWVSLQTGLMLSQITLWESVFRMESLRGWLFITCEVGPSILLGKIFIRFGGNFQIGELLSEGHFNKVYEFQSIIVYELKLMVSSCKIVNTDCKT